MQTQHDDLFPNIVGQETAKRRLAFYLRNYDATRILPHIMFVAPKGCGKTTLAKALGRNLKNSEGKTKKFLEINCSTIKSLKQFFNQIIIPHVNGQEVTVLLDEASELPKDVTMALLTILNPNEDNFTSFSYEDYVVDFDFRRISFMMATTEAQSIFHALMDRCARVDLEEYSYDELAEIINRVSKGVSFSEGVLSEIAPTLRGNARKAMQMATDVNSYLRAENKEKFGKKDWSVLRYNLGILPLGLSPIELQVLRLLGEKKQCSLTYLAAKTGLTKSCLQRDFEMYLQKQSLMEIDRGGRGLTAKGQEYLAEVDEFLDQPAPTVKKKPIRINLPNPIPESLLRNG